MKNVFNLGWKFSGEGYLNNLLDSSMVSIQNDSMKNGHKLLYDSSTKSRETDLNGQYNIFTFLENIEWFTGYYYRGQDYYQYLDSTYKNSKFIFLDMDEDIWRKKLYGTEYLKLVSFHLNRSEQVAVNTLVAQRKEYLSNISYYFKDTDQLLITNLFKDGIEPLRGFLHDYYGIDVLDKSKDIKVAKNIKEKTKSFSKINISIVEKSKDGSTNRSNFLEIVDKLSDFCSGKITANNFKNISPLLSNFSAVYDSSTDKLSHSKIVQDNNRMFISNPYLFYSGEWKHKRVAAVLNEVVKYCPDFPIVIDMQDGRNYGIKSETDLNHPVITYCRRGNAENIILWPLPVYHALDSNKMFGGMGVGNDSTPFAVKLDRAVWRGALSGHCSNVIANDLSKPCHLITKKILEVGVNDKNATVYWDLLKENIRFNFVMQNLLNEDIDAKIVLNGQQSKLKNSTKYKDLFGSKVSPQWISTHKYIVCLRGYDTASNFLMAASSNSVVLKEEDGWEVFYSCLFEPWVHYIPLAPGAIDIKEKLSWARNNQEKCLQMIQNSHEICRMLEDKKVRESMYAETIRKVDSKIHSIQEKL